MSYGDWLAAPREPRFFQGERLLFREIPGSGKRIQSALASETAYCGHSITPFIPKKESPYNLKYVLGIANSALLSWFGSLILPNFGKEVFPKLNPQDIKEIPIRPVNFDDPADVALHDRMVLLVERMLALNRKKADERNPETVRRLEADIAVTDRQIDRLVYELYNLTPAEIAIVEGGDKQSA